MGCALWTMLASACPTDPRRSVARSCWKSGANPWGGHGHPPRRAASRVGAWPHAMPPRKGRDGQRPAAAWAAPPPAHADNTDISPWNDGPSVRANSERHRRSRSSSRRGSMPPGPAQQHALNPSLRGHDTSDGRAGHIPRLLRLSRGTEQLWRKPVSRRSQDGAGRWEKFPKLTQRFPLGQPKLSIPSAGFQASAKV